MSDQPGAGPLPELTPEQESEVRRLLADARHDEPIPTNVADRLDTVLAGLTRDEPGSPGVAPVIDLAARRRRRNAAAVLAGAAAVIVTGFGIGQVIDVGSSDDSSDATSADAGADREGQAEDKANADDSGGSLDSLGESQEVAPQSTDGQPPLILRSKHLARDVEHQLLNYATSSGSVRAPAYSAFDSVGCTPPPPPNKFGSGELFPALFDGTPAVLALRPPADGVQLADVLACDTAASLASVTITPR
jgi:hypothetical protein